MKKIKYILFFVILLVLRIEVYAKNIVDNNVKDITIAFKDKKVVIVNLDILEDNLLVKRDVLDIIKSSDRKLIFNIINNNEFILYSYIFNGNEFSDSYNDIDLTIDFINKKEYIINKNINDEKLIFFENKYKGYFPNGTKLKINNITGHNQKQKMFLYKLNEKNNLELLKNNININNEFMEFELFKGDQYILSNKSTFSNNTNLVLFIIIILIFLELVVVTYLVIKRKKYIELPQLN